MKISTKTYLLELSTMIHVVRNQIKCILVNERLRDISLARLHDLICHVYPTDPSELGTVFERLGTLEELEIQYLHTRKAKARNNFTPHVIRSSSKRLTFIGTIRSIEIEILPQITDVKVIQK